MQMHPRLVCLKSFLFVFSVSLFFIAAQVSAQTDTPYTEQNKLIRAPQAFTRLGADLFGDKVNLYTGSLEFIQTDVSIPGNNILPVSVGRRLVTGADAINGALFGRWDLEIPHLHGIFSTTRGWETIGNTKARCTDFSAPPYVSTAGGALWASEEYWRGSFLYVPGYGDQEMLRRAYLADQPADGATYPIVTRNNWAVKCLTSLAAGNANSGEGFIAVSPDGTQYRFDWMVRRTLSPLVKTNLWPEFRTTSGGAGEATETAAPVSNAVDQQGQPEAIAQRIPASPQLTRSEVWILPTLVTDKYGNSVTYRYDATNQWQLTSIIASDGAGPDRVISLRYVTPGSTASNLVSSVTDGTRTWSYFYDKSDMYAQLQTVVLPDQTAWQLGGIAPLVDGIRYLGDGSCEVPGFLGSVAVSGSMRHPSGAEGQFTLTPVRHGRSVVEEHCTYDVTAGTYTPTYPKMFDTMALTSKFISGPGLTGLTWTTAYPPEASSWAPCNGCVDSKTVSVTDPEGSVTSHTFSTRFQETEGRLNAVSVAGRDGTQLRRTSMRYREPVQPFGETLLQRGDSFVNAKVQEIDQRVVEQQGVVFTWEATAFDRFAHPTAVRRFNTLGNSRSETTTYDDNLAKWAIGQIKQVTESATGKAMVLNEYDSAMASLLRVSAFGQLQRSMIYEADGTLKTLSDGKGQTTTFTDYTRGIPKNIRYADNTTESAVVNNFGRIDALTNEAGATTSFFYDSMGRLARIAYPASDTVNWEPVRITFGPSSTAQFDLTAGHWRQEVTVGNAVTVTDFDAFWRPVYTQKWDSSNSAETMRITKNNYDSAGRDIYVSYPQRSYNKIDPGTRTSYDALGRVTETQASGEGGAVFSTKNFYETGFYTTLVNARNRLSTSYYQAFDDPAKSQVRKITMPEGVSVTIQRDIFDKPLSIARSGAGVSVTRNYVYDSAERLCKTIEPEVGATVQDYDAAGNIAWRGTGLKLPNSNSCDTGSVTPARKTSFRYDTRNRLLDTTFGDNRPGINRILTPDGLPDTVSADNTTWKYLYNKRRLLESESLTYGGVAYEVGYSHDVNGTPTQLRYPKSSLTLNYKPNALGEATQVGGFATDIKYHPNGAVKSFLYGNGIRHTLTQNVRGLPQDAIDAGVLGETYTYDENANVTNIQDMLGGATRTMGYDDLDRLKTVAAPGLWGNASYDYDAVDNLTTTTIERGATARSMRHVINPATNRLDRIENGPAAFNFSYGYDDQGNVTQRGAQLFKFDLANRMYSADGRATYAYDGLGRRASTLGTDGVNKVQVYSQAGQLLYTTGGGSTTRYVYLNRHAIAEVTR